ncbi:hypothetical protein NDU88_004168 [Pleurodeles waltl]|uniref:Uncharacterized protein n=1 Tax=Pleurodeles waltl TaxID=8319 RepID=A0AAV7T7E6_PLEWA|nr:hypothetical protein NDU88_004168 [Pleurodeles waltl]
MDSQTTSQQSDLEEILKAARKAAATKNKDWVLRKIMGEGASKREEHNEPSDEGSIELTREEMDAWEKPNK